MHNCLVVEVILDNEVIVCYRVVLFSRNSDSFVGKVSAMKFCIRKTWFNLARVFILG